MPAYRKRRVIRRKRVVRRRTPRRTPRKRSGAMSRRRILNITATKKHDNMRPVVVPATGPLVPGPLVTTNGFASLYCPSARPLSESAADNQRTRPKTFSTGYKERLTVSVRTGAVWRWRRIVFTTKDTRFYDQVGDLVPWLDQAPGADRSNMARGIHLVAGQQYVRIRDILYDGQEGVDWSNEFTAKVDTTRVTLLSDKTRTINPGNETGATRMYNCWYPTRKNLVYDDDESGSTKAANYISTRSKLGMGDLMVYDVVVCAINAPGNTQDLAFSPEGVYYFAEQ